ncbi:hypothetical protein CGLAUT_06220 [Corynebacterium glaucum]|uniref:helix-turn-helix transcriptional regulator n=1 Tax=Corynebacterium glaucum TaxID=187491 RepID=UPI0025B4D612|nr:WYL domain-containing protein [Corynebacterium glaucum]WJZ07733.1 hypothetical protein CGLAUT_06220 [Corynebacterium glaucum]
MTQTPPAKQQRRERVVRLLNLLAYVEKHPESTIMEMAVDLGLEPGQIRDDLNMLHLSGVGKHGGQMIDLNHDWTNVQIIDNQGLDKPLRLTPTEANALLLLLESLETMPGLVDPATVASAARKIRAVTTGGAVGDARHTGDAATAALIKEAITKRKQLELTYYSLTSDQTRTLEVDPVDTFHHDGQTYLRAWDDGTLKSYRFDRIRQALLIDAPLATQHPQAPALDQADPFGGFDSQLAQLRVRRDATWLADYWDLELDPDELADPSVQWVRATLPYGNGDWLIRFCLGQADRVVLDQPQELADALRHRAGAALRVLG